MLNNKIKITLIFAIIFLLSVVSVTQAAPPLQEPSGTSQGHTLDLDPEGNNLGAVMESSNAEDSASDNDAQNHVAAALADYFGEMSYEEIMTLHQSGVGFGNIARALYFTANFDLGMGAADLVAEAGQSGWGKTLRDNGIHPGSFGKGRGNQPEHAKANANNGQGNSNGKGNNGQGNGNNIHGQGNNGQGHGKNKHKDGSDVADPDVDSAEDDDATDTNVDSGNDDNDAAADTDVDSEDNEANDDASNNNGRGKGKGNNGQGQGKGNNGKSKGNGNSQSHGNNDDDNGQNNNDGN